MAHEKMMASSGFCGYPDIPSTFQVAGHELLGVQAGMEMLGIPSRRDPGGHHHVQNPSMWSDEYQQVSNDGLIVVQESGGPSPAPADPWQQGNWLLSLSLTNSNKAGMQQSYNLSPSCRTTPAFFPSPEEEQQHPHMMLRGTKYLIPAQDLLNEFVNIGAGSHPKPSPKSKKPAQSQWDEAAPSLFSLDLLELQKRKAKLVSMLEEVDRRYSKYCEQMRAVVASFEAVAGDGAATVYSSLASKAMSRHFRCLRDGIVGQVVETRKAMGEKDPVVPGTTRGETPRLRLLDQCFRQQRAFQQTGMSMENQPWRPQRGLPERSVSILRAWMFEHFLHPYPSDVDKHILARQTGLSRGQVSNWFINARVRLWKPMVEEMYMEELKEEESNNSSIEEPPNQKPNPNPNHHHQPHLLPHDTDSLSSIVNTGGRCLPQEIKDPPESFDVDFASPTSFTSSRGPVSLTLELQHHTGNGGAMDMAFSEAVAAQQSFFFQREQMEDCQPVQFSILEGEGHNLPYRNLMGAQLLHDLAG